MSLSIQDPSAERLAVHLAPPVTSATPPPLLLGTDYRAFQNNVSSGIVYNLKLPFAIAIRQLPSQEILFGELGLSHVALQQKKWLKHAAKGYFCTHKGIDA